MPIFTEGFETASKRFPSVGISKRYANKCAGMYRNRQLRQLIIGLITAVLILGGFLYGFLRVTNPAIAGSTVSSLYHLLLTTNEIKPTDEHWQHVPKAEYLAFVQMHDSKIDGPGLIGWWRGDGVLVDPWGNLFRIATRKGKDGSAEFVVWSNGRDGVQGTADDIQATSGGVKVRAVTLTND